MNPATQQRALLAIKYMMDKKLGIHAAATTAKTTARTVIKYMMLKRIIFKRSRKKGDKGRIFVDRSPAQKRFDFLELMNEGRSATRAAYELHTQVRTMSKQTLPDSTGKDIPIISKSGDFWVTNFAPLYGYSIVYYGYVLGLSDRIQGRAKQAGPKATKDGADDDYSDIWWQIDFDDFKSTLSIRDVGEFWKPHIMAFLRKAIETPKLSDPSLSRKFLSNPKVSLHATTSGRIMPSGSLKVSELEKMMQRYDVKLSKQVNYGVDDSGGAAVPQFIDKDALAKKLKRTTVGKFQVLYLNKSTVLSYPHGGPRTIRFKYSLGDE